MSAAVRAAALLTAAVALAAATTVSAPPPALPYAASLDPARWSTYANGSADQRFPLAADGAALAFDLPQDREPFFTAQGRSPSAPSADYLFTDAPPLAGAHALTAVFTLTLSPGATLNARFEASNTCPAGPTVRLLISTPGPLTNWMGATLPYTRWYSDPIALTPGDHTLTVPLDGAHWTDVFADRADATTPPRGQSQSPAAGFQSALTHPRLGLVLGGGCFAGHGVGVVSGTGRFELRKLEAE